MFVIVRHGNTFGPGEAPRRIGARTDLPLTSEGAAQAAALGAHFVERGWRFGRALVSPLLRTRQTAQAILAAQTTVPEIEERDWLREVDHGPDEDQAEDTVLARIGRQALLAWDERGEPPPDWIVDGEARRRGWQALFADKDARHEPILIVTSNGAARFALLSDPALVAGLAARPSLKLPTGGYGAIHRASSGALEITQWGVRP